MAKHQPTPAGPAITPVIPRPRESFPQPTEAVAIVRGDEFKWYVLHLKLLEGLVCDAKILERTIHLDLAQDAARRAVLRLRS
jgi:hypothetical protein